MPRSRKSNPAPILGTIPSEGATLEGRTRYLLQELGEEAGFLEQWIVHYLTELLDRADDSNVAPDARSEARTELARVIPILWEQQIAREALYVRCKVNDLLSQAEVMETETGSLLSPLLADPNKAAELSGGELSNTLRALYTLTEHATRLVFIAASAERAKQEVISESVWRFLQRDEELQGLKSSLAGVVPDFATVETTNLDAIERLVHSTLVAAAQAQLTLLSRIAPDDCT